MTQITNSLDRWIRNDFKFMNTELEEFYFKNHYNDIHFDIRAKGIRLPPHLYNSELQIDSLKSLIANN